MKPKILFFLMNGTGGAERVTITISNFFDKREYDIKYVLVQRGDSRILQFMKPEIPIIKIPSKRIYFSSIPIYRLLKKERPDVVFCASPAINARLIMAAKLAGNIRVIIRNSNMFDFERKDVQWLMKLTYKWADKIILQQDQMREDLHCKIQNLPREKTITLYNPIDVEHINEGIKVANPYPINDTSVNYLWVARFAHEKGQDLLVRAFVIVHGRNPKTHLWLVGHNDTDVRYTGEVMSMVKENNLGDFIHFVGHDSNPYRWMKYCDCFVLPSRFEGLPNALIEAMYLGRPVVAARCLDIITNIIKEGKNGYTCEVGNVDELAIKMEMAISLKDCKMSYKPSSKEQFVKLFNN